MDYEKMWNDLKHEVQEEFRYVEDRAHGGPEKYAAYERAYRWVLTEMKKRERKQQQDSPKQGIEYEYPPPEKNHTEWTTPKAKRTLVMHHDDSMDKLKERVEKLEWNLIQMNSLLLGLVKKDIEQSQATPESSDETQD